MSIVDHSALIEGEKSNDINRAKHVDTMLDALHKGTKKVALAPYDLRKWHENIFPYGGDWRTSDLSISSGSAHLYASVAQQPMWSRMSDYLDSLDLRTRSYQNLAQAHWLFENIHPFDDGNGRVGRILLNYHARYLGFGAIRLCHQFRKQYITAMQGRDLKTLTQLINKGETSLK